MNVLNELLSPFISTANLTYSFESAKCYSCFLLFESLKSLKSMSLCFLGYEIAIYT